MQGERVGETLSWDWPVITTDNLEGERLLTCLMIWWADPMGAYHSVRLRGLTRAKQECTSSRCHLLPSRVFHLLTSLWVWREGGWWYAGTAH